jgi:hypothetical protein
MGEFFNYDRGVTPEHFCGEYWVPDPDNVPHEKCKVCGKLHILTWRKAKAALEELRGPSEDELAQLELSYQVEVPLPCTSMVQEEKYWGLWSSGKGRDTWSSLKRAQAALRTAASPPESYRIIEVHTQPAVVIHRKTVENVSHHDPKGPAEPDYKVINKSKAWADEGERPVTDLDDDDQWDDNDRTHVDTVPSVVDYDPQDGEKLTTRFEENFKIRGHTLPKG